MPGQHSGREVAAGVVTKMLTLQHASAQTAQTAGRCCSGTLNHNAASKTHRTGSTASNRHARIQSPPPPPPPVCLPHLQHDQLHQLLSCLCPTRVHPPGQGISLSRAQPAQVQLARSSLPHQQPGLGLQLHYLPPNRLSLTSRQPRHLRLTQAGQHRQAASSCSLSTPGSQGLVQSLQGATPWDTTTAVKNCHSQSTLVIFKKRGHSASCDSSCQPQ